MHESYTSYVMTWSLSSFVWTHPAASMSQCRRNVNTNGYALWEALHSNHSKEARRKSCEWRLSGHRGSSPRTWRGLRDVCDSCLWHLAFADASERGVKILASAGRLSCFDYSNLCSTSRVLSLHSVYRPFFNDSRASTSWHSDLAQRSKAASQTWVQVCCAM